MRKLKLQVQTSIDGFIAGLNHEMTWMKLPWSEDLISYVRALTAPVDTVLLGKNLAEGFIPYWEEVAKNPEHADYEGGVKFTTTPKIVFSKTLKDTKWENTRIANGNLEDEINTLKKQQGGDIIAYGGANFVSGLIKHNLIDDYHLLINPSAIGKGLPIFSFVTHEHTFELNDCRKFNCGIAVLHYRRFKK